MDMLATGFFEVWAKGNPLLQFSKSLLMPPCASQELGFPDVGLVIQGV